MQRPQHRVVLSTDSLNGAVLVNPVPGDAALPVVTLAGSVVWRR
jgi:hypothetical protein